MDGLIVSDFTRIEVRMAQNKVEAIFSVRSEKKGVKDKNGVVLRTIRNNIGEEVQATAGASPTTGEVVSSSQAHVKV